MPSREFMTVMDGVKQDASMHEPILNNKKADKAISEVAVARAISRGMDPVLADLMYGDSS